MVELGGGKKASHGGTALAFSEVVGQEELKRALLAVAANDDLDGLLVQGEKGTAKSTTVRALTELLPTQAVVEDCPYGCPPDAVDRQCERCRERHAPPTAQRSVPLVTLPLGATRERVVGTLSVADALAGDYEFEPGLLARANRGILYVDEVNLLDDHLVDVLLDAAASGVNRVERDGVSVSHPAEFTLVGTMNPEEGELRPQLRDRFALQATVTGCADLDRRVTIIDRAIGGIDGTSSEGSGEATATGDARRQLRRARDRLPEIELSTEFARDIAELCRDAGVEGHRGDIATARAAMTFAALDDRTKVVRADLRRAAELALPHRLRSRPFEDAPDPSDLIDDQFGDERSEDETSRDETSRDETSRGETNRDETRGDGASDDEASDEEDGRASGGSDGAGGAEGRDGDSSTSTGQRDQRSGESSDGGEESPDEPGPRESSTDRTSDPVRDEGSDGGPKNSPGGGDEGAEASAGERDQAGERSDERTGNAPVVPGETRAGVGEAAAPDLAAPDAVEAGRANGGTRSLTRTHVDNDGARVRTQRASSTRRIDAAASVRAATARGASSVESRDLRQSVRQSDGAALVLFVVDASASMRPAMRAAKSTVLELLKDAYQQRDEVGFVTFAGDEAEVLLPPTNSVSRAARHLKDLPTGDRTPLPAGLRTATDVLDRADPSASVVVLVTDGRANVADGSPVQETREAARRLSESGSHVVVVDAGDGDRSALTGLIAAETDGNRVPLSALSAGRIDEAVAAARES